MKEPGAVVGTVICLIMLWQLSPFALFLSDANTTIVTTRMALAEPPPEDPGAAWLRLSWLIVYVASVMLVFHHLRQIQGIFRNAAALTVLVALAWLSTFWSLSPDDTFRRAIGLTATTVFGVYLGCRFTPLQIVTLLGRAVMISLIASFAFAVIDPERGATTDQAPGAWRGVFVNKNSLGHAMVLGCLAYYVLWQSSRKRKYLVYFALSAALMFLSRAVTPLFIGLAIVPAACLVRWYYTDRRRIGLILGTTIGLLAIASVSILPNFDGLMSWFGKDPTLTGRTDIWALSWEAILQSFWLGYGYDAFWVPDGPAEQIWETLNWRTPNAHNGFLELWLALGVLGVAMFGWLYFGTLRDTLRRLPLSTPAEMSWSTGFLLLYMGYCINESATLVANDISWVLFCAVVATNHRIVFAQPARAAKPGRFQTLADRKLVTAFRPMRLRRTPDSL